MPILSPEAVEFATEIFNASDADGSGSIDKAELKVAATKMAEHLEMQPPSDADVERQMEALDVDGVGTVSLKEFLTFLAMTKVLMICAAMFADVDTDGSGSIETGELKTVVTQIYESEGLEAPTDEKVEEFAKELDQSGDGKIDFSEFAAFMIPVIVALAEG